MSLHLERRRFLVAVRQHGDIQAAATVTGIDPKQHEAWLQDALYRSAFAEIEKERKLEAAGKLPPPKPKARIGRPPKPKPENPLPKRPRGRPPRNPAPTLPPGSPNEPVPVPGPPEVPLLTVRESKAPPPAIDPPGTTPSSNTTASGNGAPIPRALPDLVDKPPERAQPSDGVIEPSVRGYTRLYVKEDELPAVQEPPKQPAKEEPPEAPLEITVTSDAQQRALIDEYGELDRRMKLRATDTARYESLKRAIKSWFDSVPADADGTVEGDVYLLHLSACERERKVRSLRELADVIGIDKVLDLAAVSIGQLENLLGKNQVAAMTIETRSGSRRIRAIPKRPAAVQ